MNQDGYTLLTLDEAKRELLHGAYFGDVYPFLQEVDRVEFRDWFVHHEKLPNKSVRDSHIPFLDTGERCSRCDSLNLRIAGSCKTCNDCGESQGCG